MNTGGTCRCTSAKVPHNKPDLILWNIKEKHCDIIEFSCPADVNVTRKVAEKENIYGPLIRNLQMLYSDYSYSFYPIIVGALGTVPMCLSIYIRKLGFNKSETSKLIRLLQVVAISGTVKICKTFVKFKVS